MSGMSVPEWAGDLRKQMVEVLKDLPTQANADVVKLTPVTEFSTFFAEYTVKGKDLIIHFFPRRNGDDEWYEAHTINRCDRCRKELSSEVMQHKKPCPECKCTRRVCVPGRREEDLGLQFPPNILALIKDAVDSAWLGDAAVEETKLLYYDKKANIEYDEPKEITTGSIAVQLRGAATAASLVGIDKFLDKICSELDSWLEKTEV